jgi:glutathione synthase/RimK-type ligase-like ATP-grasp enzyme
MRADTVLLVTASYDVAADYVLKALLERGTPAFRLNTDEFPSSTRVSFVPPDDIRFIANATSLAGRSVKSVWYRRHVAPALPAKLQTGVQEFCERETSAFLNGVLASLPTERWMSSPLAISQAERKPYQLAVAAQLGFTVPDTLISNDPLRVADMAGRHRLVAKAVSSGYVASPEGNRAIFTSALGPEDVSDLDGLVLAPVVFQELVDKVSDIRVTVIAGEVFAAEILSQERQSSRVDWRATDDPHLQHRIHSLPEKTANLCRRLVDRLGLVFGAIDLALRADGSYMFFEINPNGEWVWLEDQLGFPIAERIAQWLATDSS